MKSSCVIRTLLLILLVLVACEPRLPRAPRKKLHPPLSDQALNDLVKRVVAARKVELARPVRVDRLDEKAFVAELQAAEADDEETEDEDSAAPFLLAFEVPTSGPSAERIVNEGTLGFYDMRRKRVFYRARPLASAEDRLKERLVLAHEVQHALQDQHHNLRAFQDVEGADSFLARLALVEGDAMLSVAAYVASSEGVSVARLIHHIFDRVAVADVAHQRERNALDDASPLMRARFEFPYKDGLRFAADLYRAGGYALLERSFEMPPESSEHILHPQKYLDGDLPVPVEPPPAPDGWEIHSQGRMGELLTAVMLSSCLGEIPSAKAAAGWGGDSYSVLTDDDGNTALIWVTTWDDESEAREFEKAANGASRCWRSRKLTEDKTRFAVGASKLVRRAGKRVVVLRGFEASKMARLAKQSLSLVGAVPARRPVATERVPELKSLPERVPGTVQGNRFRSEWLGLSGYVPKGMTWKIDDTSELSVNRRGALVTGSVLVHDRVHNVSFNTKVLAELANGFARGIGVGHLQPGRITSRRLHLGDGIEATWYVLGTSAQISVVLLPICNEHGSLVFIRAYGDGFAKHVMDGWLNTFRWLPKQSPGVCGRLNPK